MNRRVLFVCTGNICRSPLAEALAKRMYADLGLEFLSAGLAAPDGHPASEGSRLFVEDLGLTLAGHRSRPVTAGLLRGTAWVIGMTGAHAAEILGRFGAHGLGRVGILGAPGLDLAPTGLLPLAEDVDDPYGRPPAAYRVVGEQVQRLLAGWSDAFAAAGRLRPADRKEAR